MARKVLIVDDSEINRKLLRLILSDEYAVVEAQDGREALEILRRRNQIFSAILLDLIMPNLNGYQVLEQLQLSPILSQIPVIVATASTDSEAELKALNCGATDFVYKPYNAEIIRRRVRNLIKLRESSAIINNMQRDKLTGLYNREAFFGMAANMIAAKPPRTYILSSFDIDRFKVVNDQYGSEKGDKVIRDVARIFQEALSQVSSLFARITGDNFAMLYPAECADSPGFQEARDRASLLDGSIPPLSFSIGRYLVDDVTVPVSDMYDRASIARSSVKGRYDVHIARYDDAMRGGIIRQQQIVNEMNEALREGQFEAWYQPQYNHATGALIGAEALARWRHPVWGLVSPGEFIPVFERNGFVYELDKCIWEDVCQHLRTWIDQGKSPLPVSVNISRYDLFRDDLMDVLMSILQKYDLPVDLLRLEITESAFSDSTEQVVRAVKRFIEKGFTVEIDDFGSGYSSLNTLKDVPAQILKLDMRFLESSDNQDRGGNILESVVRMAKWLGMSVIAEGVERNPQADYLMSIGCNYVQGYLYAKPMTAKEYEAKTAGAGKEERLIAMEAVENLDNNAFWNPESMDTLIFNSYVGAACIFEYQDGRIEMIRSTKRFSDMLGGKRLSVGDTLKLDWLAHLDEASRATIGEALKRSISSKEESVCELTFLGLPGCPERVFLRSALRVIATAGVRSLVYCTSENITAQRLAENQRQAAERKISSADEQLRFLNEVSGDLLAQPEIDKGIDGVLRKILRHFGANRAYVIEQSESRMISSNTYEVCAPGVESEMANLQAIPNSAYASWFMAFQRGEIIHIPDVSALPQDRASEREILMAQGIRSLIAVPFHRDGALMGFIGLDDPTLRRDQAEQLRALGDYLAVMLTRRDLTQKIEREQRTLQAMMDDMPGGFVRMRAYPDGHFAPLYANAGFCNLVGMSFEAFSECYKDDSMRGVHPDDRAVVEAAVAEMMSSGEAHSEKYRLRHGSGGYVWVRFFGRMTQAEDGANYFNVYYTAVSERERRQLGKAEMLSMALSSIMSETPNLAFVKDVDGRYVFSSRQIAEVTGASSVEELIGKTDDELMPQRFAALYGKLNRQVIQMGKPLVNISVPLPGKDGGTRYANLSKYPLRDARGEVIGIYGIGRDITQERSSFAQLKLLSDSIPGGIATFAASPDEIRITYFSDGLCRMLGCTREEYLSLSKQGVLSRVYPEDLPNLTAQIDALRERGAPIDCTYRNHRVNGDGCIWINIRGALTERVGDTAYFSAALYDVTERQEMIERLRVHEEELRIAMSQMGSMICEYDIATETLTLPESLANRYGAPTVLPDVPNAVLAGDFIDEADHPAYVRFYDAILRGEKRGEMEYRGKWADGTPHWARMEFATIADSQGIPVKAVIAVEDTTARHDESKRAALERERLYTAIMNLSPMVISANLTQNSYSMLSYENYATKAAPWSGAYDELIDIGAGTVPEQDRQAFLDTFSRARVLAAFADGKAKVELDHRQVGDDGVTRWIRTQSIKVNNPYDGDILSITLALDIDEKMAYQALLQRQYDLTIENMPNFVAKWLFKDGDVLLLDANQKYLDFMGISGRDAFGKSIIYGFTPEEKAAVIDMLYGWERNRESISFTSRASKMDGSECWLSVKASFFEEREGCSVYFGTLTDVTDLIRARDALRESEEMFRIASEMSGMLIGRYDIRTRRYIHNSRTMLAIGIPSTLENAPQAFVEMNMVAPESADELIALYDKIRLGVSPCSADVRLKMQGGGFSWCRMEANVISDEAGRPSQAIIVTTDISKQREKEAVYKRWQQSIGEMSPQDYTLMRWNLSRDEAIEGIEGELLKPYLASGIEGRFNENMRAYAAARVCPEDRETFSAALNSDAMLASFHRGLRRASLEYREIADGDDVRWLKLTVELVEYPNATEVEAYMMFENIDARKREELSVREKAELDPLTGVLNRAAFAARMEEYCGDDAQGGQIAVMMMDVDGFKLLNDTFGHAAGDRALIDMADALRGILRADDLLGRLGGDEFLVGLKGALRDADIENKARQICAMLRRRYGENVQTSVSVGIAVCPRDGASFDAVYRKADLALYHVKDSGKDNFAFYAPGMGEKRVRGEAALEGEEGEA